MSPKVLMPLIAGVTIGTILLGAGLAFGDVALKVAGTSVLLGAATQAGIGYAVPHEPKKSGRVAAHVESRRSRA